jgi:hypothetical protein
MPYTHKSYLAEMAQREQAQRRARREPRIGPFRALLLGIGIGLGIWVVVAAVFWLLA